MIGTTGRGRRLRWLPLIAAVGLGAAGCEDDDDLPTGPGSGLVDSPEVVDATYDWIFQGWEAGQPVQDPTVDVTWELPAGWDGEVFRVYGRRSGQSDYTLLATVTSCTSDGCRYRDVNVEPGSTYEYFVTAVDERFGDESDGSPLVRVALPSASVPAAPGAVRAVGLDGAVYLQWDPTGDAERYWVVLESSVPDEPFDIGETDGSGYLDTRAENGVRGRYRVAAIDTLGRVGVLGPVVEGIARPDYQAELIYAFADSASRSGFRFVESDDSDPIVAGNASTAHFRLEVVDGVLSFVPRGETEITSGVLTTALTCGPGSDPDCFSIDRVDDPDAPDDFSSEPVAVAAELTYLLRVRGDDGRDRFAKVRVALEGVDQEGRDIAVFDWAYQLIPGEPSLNRR